MTARSRGILLMVLTVASFAAQDGISRALVGQYSPLMIVMVRYWIFAAFLLGAALRRPEGLRAATRSRHFGLHVLRGLLLVSEICVIVWSYRLIGLINAHAVFAICPLLIVVLSSPMLGERIDPLLWVAVAIGFVGVLIILMPGAGVFSWAALLPLASAVMFALFSVLTRLTARDEGAFAALFWPPIVGLVFITALGLPQWQDVEGWDWVPILLYGLTAALSNYLLQRTYETTEASAVQPYAYLQIVFVALIGVSLFDEVLHLNVAIGAAVVVGAGLVALVQQRQGART